MHAIQVHETGGPEVLTWEETAEPDPGPGQLRASVVAAGVNYIDTYHRRGIYPLSLPAIISADRAVPVPEGTSLMTAAAAMLQGITAHYLATDTFRLRAGQRCLIHAGAGGVGRLLVQMARRVGAEVFTTVSTPDKARLAGEAGATHVINYTNDDFVETVEQIAGDRSLDVIYDGVGAATFERGLTLLKPRGLMVLFGQSSGVVPPFDLGALARLGSLYVTRPTMGSYIATSDALRQRTDELFAMVANGELEIRIDRTMPLSDAAVAHRVLESRQSAGKILLVP